MAPTLEAAATRSRPSGSLQASGMQRGLFHILDGEEADASVIVVDHDELLDAMLVEQPARLVGSHAFAHRDDLLGHEIGHGLARIVGEADIAIGQDADDLGRQPQWATLDHGDAGDVVPLHQLQSLGERGVGVDGDRIDHHAALEAFDLAHFFGLRLRFEIAVDDPDATRLRHGDGEPRFRHRIHGG